MNDVEELIPTRQSLLERLKQWNDQESWKVFFDTYWRLIYCAAKKAGLSDAEAQDVVQETVISVLKSMPSFEYQAKHGSFKSWLLQLTSWRIVDQFRKRGPEYNRSAEPAGPITATGTADLEQVADSAGLQLEALWDREWESNLMEAAVERVKRKVNAKDYQIFDLYVFKQWPVARVTRALNVSAPRVYLTKHRVGNLIKKEVARLREKPF